ncbi:MAG: hypothetical protein RSE46_19790, partial [Janthinobacterium sp.]
MLGAQQGRGQGRVAIDGVDEDGHAQAGRIAEQIRIGVQAARIDVHARGHADLLLHALQPRLVQLGRAGVFRDVAADPVGTGRLRIARVKHEQAQITLRIGAARAGEVVRHARRQEPVAVLDVRAQLPHQGGDRRARRHDILDFRV